MRALALVLCGIVIAQAVIVVVIYRRSPKMGPMFLMAGAHCGLVLVVTDRILRGVMPLLTWPAIVALVCMFISSLSLFIKIGWALEEKLRKQTRRAMGLDDHDQPRGGLVSPAVVLLAGLASVAALTTWHGMKEQLLPVHETVTAADPFPDQLAELQNRPTLAAVMYFQVEPVRPERRQAVAAALEAAKNNPSRSVSFAAAECRKRWEE